MVDLVALLRDNTFPLREKPENEDIEEERAKDPLATQIWRLYARTKAQLPHKERLENLTWRMMAMRLRRSENKHGSEYDDDER